VEDKRVTKEAQKVTVRQFDEFEQYLAAERGLSANTRASYRRDLDALGELAGVTPLAKIQSHQIRRFVAHQHARGLSGRSLARMLSAWRGFYGWLTRRKGLASNPCAGMRAPKSAKALPHALSPDVAAKLLDSNPDTVLLLRDRAMFELLYSSGLRLAELVSLDLASRRDIANGEIEVTGKGSKTRVVPVGAHAAAAVAAWLGVRGSVAKHDETAMFVNQKGGRLGPRAVQSRLQEWALRQGVAGGVHPHMLRHSFASHVLQSSSDLRAVQEMLGHASISTTQVYTHLDFQHLAKVYDAAHPRARKKTAQKT
jgi:integrase/recombinase XerC